jgi:fatty-acyl-CoA synthase
MFISGGENVYPAEIEAALASFDGLMEVAVVGVPDDRWGEVGVCIYVASTEAVTTDVLIAHLEPRLARYKIPKRFVPRGGLPRTGSGKVLKAVLREWRAETRP